MNFINNTLLNINGCKKKKMKIILQGLLNFSRCLEKETFTCDWVEGSSDGFKKEHFIRHDKHESHKKCMQKYESILGTLSNRAGVRNVWQALFSKLNAQRKAQLGMNICSTVI